MRRAAIVAVIAVILLVTFVWFGAPRLGRWYIASRLIPRAAVRLGCEVGVKHISVGFGRVELLEPQLRCPGDGEQPLFAAAHVQASFALAPLLRGRAEIQQVLLSRPAFGLRRAADGGGNVRRLLARVRDRPGRRGAAGRAGEGPRRLSVGAIRLTQGTLSVRDDEHDVQLLVSDVGGTLVPEGPSRVVLRDVRVESALVPSTLRLERVEVAGLLTPRQPKLPRVRLDGGHIRLLPRLSLTGIRGMIVPAGPSLVRIDLDGSYGGAQARLWQARGTINPFERRGELEVRAERFDLGRIESILRETPIIQPKRTTIGGELKLGYANKTLSFDGGLEVEHLNLFHPGLARTPVLDLSGSVALAGHYGARVLDVTRFDVKSRGLEAQSSLRLDRSQAEPVFVGRLLVPPVKCQQVLDAFPSTLIPHLKGFKLRGQFAVDLHANVDFAKLSEIDLGGMVGINRCKVIDVPADMSAQRLAGSFEHTVEPAPGETLTFTIGPENPDFTPYDMISPNIIGAFLTTEDAAFFRHRGFIPSQFRAALGRNLKRGSFRLGASTITMQTVKNVLLSQEKTLSRKLQEMFLVWYVEQNLSKERLMEIYLNAIEFGPGIFGIGRAARHYFGKHPIEITPLEAAFFATILPSPRRRYVQYCDGKLSPKWDRYVRRVLRKMHARGHITDEALEASAEQQIVFDRDTDELSVAACRNRIKELSVAWREEYLRKIKESVLSAAPHQLSLYMQPDPDPASNAK